MTDQSGKMPSVWLARVARAPWDSGGPGTGLIIWQQKIMMRLVSDHGPGTREHRAPSHGPDPADALHSYLLKKVRGVAAGAYMGIRAVTKILSERENRSGNDCVVIGADIRLPPKNFLFFEAVINAVHRSAPHSAIGFNTRPEETAEAAARLLNLG
ncbi:hypothetical protein [Streptomyces sp. NPDC059894]|uniref:hypothetical protein n=1 Tax=unclassified Streptomyces TaxID=2593676 RepID=UPI003657CF3B